MALTPTLLALSLLLAPQSAPAGRLPLVSSASEDSGGASRVQLQAWSDPALRPPYVGARAAELGDAPEVIHAGNARFSAREELALPAELRFELFEHGAFRPGWFLVHFDRSPSRADKALLDELSGPVRGRDGAELARWYLPNRTLAVWVADWTQHVELAQHGGVLAVTRYQPAYKLSPTLGRAPLSSPARLADPRLRLDVDLIPGTDAAALAAQVAALGLEVEREVHLGTERRYALHFLVVWALPEQLVDLARLEGVRYVQESGDGLALHDFSAGGKLQNRSLATDNGAADVVNGTDFPLWFTHDLQGQGQVIGVVDTHVDPNNGPPTTGFACDGFGTPDALIDSYGFAAPVGPALTPQGNGTSSKVPRVILRSGAVMSSTNPPSDPDNHGQHVSTAALADFYGSDDTKWFQNDPDQWDGVALDQYGLLGPGLAHEAQLVFAPVLDANNGFAWAFNFVGNMGNTIDDMAGLGAAATVHSTGIVEDDNVYSTLTVAHDLQAFQNPKTLQCVAAGNDGFDGSGDQLTSQAVAKNVLTVGASDDVLTPERRAAFSSAGPRFDGAIKPDILTPGTDGAPRTGTTIGSGLVLPDSNGALSTDPCAITDTDGTSFSAPIAGAAVALIHQYFEEGRYVGAQTVTDPSAALMKAVLVNAGERLTGANTNGGSYPSGLQGWGEPNLSNALEFSGSVRNLVVYDAPGGGPSTFGDATDLPWFFRFDVTGTEELRATLAWTDEPGTVGTGKQLVNDLDLALRTPGAGEFDYLGNVFGAGTGLSVTGGSADTLNNVENVRVGTPASGTWIARVAPSDGNFDGSQGFGLVLTGELTEGEFFRPGGASVSSLSTFTPPAALAEQSAGTVDRTVIGAFRVNVADDEDLAPASIQLTFTDSAIEAFGAVELWYDSDADGSIDTDASPLATGVFGDGTITFTDAGAFPAFEAGGSVALLVSIGVPPEMESAGLLERQAGWTAGLPLGTAAGLAAALALATCLLRRGGRRPSRGALASLAGVVLALALAPACGGGGGDPSYQVRVSASGLDFTGVDSLAPAQAGAGTVTMSFSVTPAPAP